MLLEILAGTISCILSMNRFVINIVNVNLYNIKGLVPLEQIAVAFTSDYEIIAFLGIRD